MSNTVIDPTKTTSIYSSEPLSTGLMQRLQALFYGLNTEVKALSQLSESLSDTISVVVTDRLECFDGFAAEAVNCLILIVPQSLNVPSTGQFSTAVIYKRSDDETIAVALEKIFSSLIKFTVMSTAYLDTLDINSCLQFRNHRYLNVFHGSFERLEYLSNGENFISQLTQNDSIMITINTQTSCTKESYRILEPVLKHLGEDFDAEIFWGCQSHEHLKQNTDFYILQSTVA